MMMGYWFHSGIRVCLGISIFLFICASASFASPRNVDVRATNTTVFSEHFSAELYGGYLKGKSHELVYDEANGYHKVSELIWSIDDAYVVGVSLALRPVERLKISVGGWLPFSSGNTMDDYDWLVNGFSDWSHWSHHSDTTLHQAYMIDTRAAYTLTSFKRRPDITHPWRINQASLDLIAGYRWFKLDWTAYGGSFIYSDGGIRNHFIQFPDGQPVISYEQWWEVPYAGLGGRLSIDRWTLSAEVIGSLWGKGRDRDDHHLRTLLFEESFSNVGMLAANVGIDCDLTKHWAVFARFDYEKFFEGKGATTETNYSTGAVTTYGGDAAGADFSAMLFSLGLKLKF